MGYVLQQNKGMPGPCTKLHLRKKVWLRTLADGESVRGKRKNGREAQRGWRWNARGERCRQRERDCLYEPLRDTYDSIYQQLFETNYEREEKKEEMNGGWGWGPVQSNTLHHPEAMQCALSNFFKSHIKIYLHFLFSLGLQAALKFVWHKLSQRLWSHWSQNGADLPGWPLDLLP